MTIITAIITFLLGNKAVAGLVASAVTIFGAVIYGRSKGKKAERNRQVREREKTDRKIDKVEDSVSGKSADDLRDSLKKWSDK